MLELLEALDHLKDITESPATNADQLADLQDPEYLTALCQIIGSPMFSELVFKQQETKKIILARIAEILMQKKGLEQVLLLQHLIIQVYSESKALAKSNTTTAGKQSKSARTIPTTPQPKEKVAENANITHFNWLPAYLKD